ncbi:hypothetical protein F8154_09450 [Alkaliphilus pronyensis]|uniref:MrpA C-terminal/MbhE domain-containing protein n=1 Tax=Alkaliphilus pronyensis TaxID=1482732 RepID=A0A6I0FAF5_9FIRM|nr:hydrogen gas-evolving membrane-bound hydrogenase subunit E [Alkaliphilus pronyensis]KAB3534153.1 hypothetical protein F8154_09450 [Alkaliphilus pronyensis]
MKKALVILVLLGLFVLLTSSVLKMPSLGSIDNPSYNETSVYYIENAIEDTHAPNAIASIITDYRSFDTLGETTVLFTSIAAVLSVLRLNHNSKEKGDKNNG